MESKKKNEENESGGSSSSSINITEKEKEKERTPILPPSRYPSYRAYPPEFHYSPVHNVFI
jgi:hypothetical protein